jgi:DNA-binding transcriptional LysR family regulator
VAVALAHFHQAFPRIELSVTQGGSRDLVSSLALGQLDLAVIVLPLQVGDPALETLPLLREELMVAAPSVDPPQLRGGRVHITDLKNRPLVMFRQGYDLRETILAAWRQAGVEPLFAIEGGEMDAVLRFVEAGIGLALVPSVVLPGRPGIAAFPIAQPGLQRTIALARRKDVRSTRAAWAFRETLLTHIRGEAASASLPPGVRSLLT